mgnify:CR=1 FL=1
MTIDDMVRFGERFRNFLDEYEKIWRGIHGEPNIPNFIQEAKDGGRDHVKNLARKAIAVSSSAQ